MKQFIAAFLALLATAAPVRAQGGQRTAGIDYATARLERALTIRRATSPIVLDGSLDEAAWLDAPAAKGFIQNDPREGRPATFDTEVKVIYDDEAIYFGVFAKDDEPSRIIVND